MIKVSAIIPCYDEKNYIRACLDSIVNSDLNKSELEVFVVDGGSTDGTIEIILEYQKNYSYIKLVDNPKKILASAWNIGVKKSVGKYIVAMNSHAKIEASYFNKAIRYLEDYHADCVGPVIVTHPQDQNLIGKSIAIAMSHPFGVGNSYFRIGASEPRWVDTVHFGTYRSEIFKVTGGYNESLVRSQDIEFHKRILKLGYKILLAPEIKVHYYTRSNPKGFIRYGVINGYWATKPLQFGVNITRIRHLIPALFVLTMIFIAFISIMLGNYIFLIVFFLVYLLIGYFILLHLYTILPMVCGQ